LIIAFICAHQAELESKSSEAESLKATILQAEAAMIQLSEQSQAEQNQVVEESKRKIAKLKEQQKKKIAQLKTDHCAVADGIYTRSDGALFFL
jgi:predicted Holliday junction resolvase-like endonuclease